MRTSCREAAAWIGRVGSDTAGDGDDDDDDGLKDFRQKLFASIRIYPFNSIHRALLLGYVGCLCFRSESACACTLKVVAVTLPSLPRPPLSGGLGGALGNLNKDS